MDHADHVELLRPAHLAAGGTWADLGAGAGAFTLALRELVGREAEIYAVDKDRGSLDELGRAYQRRFGEGGRLHMVQADFSRALPQLPALDGVIMANSLHFFKDKLSILGSVRQLLKPDGRLLLVEYNVDRGNMWVPYPLSFPSFKAMAQRAGFTEPRLLRTHPSRFLKGFYSALSSRRD